MRQIIAYAILGWAIAPFAAFFKEYVFDDFEFLKFLFVICAVDTALGFFKAVVHKNVSSRGFSMVFTKIIIYSAALICSHVLVSFTVHNKAYAVFSWVDTVIFSGIIVREAVSIFENIALIDPTAVPKRLLKYLKDFDSFTGIKKLENEKDK
jgi:toxin secretion/phage lysis holin